ncbi:MAG: glycosyltransferase family 39 protein [Candidatus Eisenbacteria bacterium]|uniref:Glycosyltransferase family 39 protein n=1 Tax=Eiseniibacteriota bacterium TaxID=2212470 RepID=A0A933SDR8_UNCEI|nr:glycosyltransferase family 39 protein [Candidatus Eisenbacteria bacterium]
MTPDRIERVALVACALVLALLLAIRMDAPWTYIHDDNGAWTQAVAGAHLDAGLARTRGQDFYLRRADGGLTPYLHHPPLYPLVMAAAYSITGERGPLATRAIPAAFHLIGFLGFVLLARALFPESHGRRVIGAALYAVVPMSAFFGKLAFNEPLGLALCVWALLFTVRDRARPSAASRIVACSLWASAIATSWTSTCLLAAFAGLAVFEGRGPARARAHSRAQALALSGTALLAPALVVLHLLWAGHWQRPPIMDAGAHWGGAAVQTGEFLRGLGVAFDFHRIYFANVPFAFYLGWLGLRISRIVRGQALSESDRVLLAGSIGAGVWALVFLRQVAIHAYGQFWFLPFEALAAADAAVSAWHSLAARPRLRQVAAVLLVAGTLASAAYTLHYRYSRPHGFAIRNAQRMAEEYVTGR